jgi:DNA-binding transcriptional regulator of glucitol operon
VPLRRRLGLILLVIVAAGGCLALGWWQWSRWESASGSFQNLGYALQWPMFAGFCVYAYRKFLRMEQMPQESTDAPEAITEIPGGLLPERPSATTAPVDPVMQEYNAYLAELAEKDKRTTA